MLSSSFYAQIIWNYLTTTPFCSDIYVEPGLGQFLWVGWKVRLVDVGVSWQQDDVRVRFSEGHLEVPLIYISLASFHMVVHFGVFSFVKHKCKFAAVHIVKAYRPWL
jgi:hypothetical protein